ncbi:hypothetical protein [Thermomonospora cellulosilytica]|uniref:Uncharacterized protein n=1 Tax=Thermomonospora cellulosilytica TaxID=1411118 RepID=A0A7W3MXK0_9ACTN|nr:hypothetical protein [Thermomonospora cellulosilytica]MBA9003694.1 hypothetical protein [Thermomonospora cellulosilytica]
MNTRHERTLRELLQLAANTICPAPDGLERIRAGIAARATNEAAAGSEAPAAATADNTKEASAMTTVQKHPLELEPGDRVVNPYDDREVIVTAPPVRCEDRVSIDYRIPSRVTPSGVGRMAVDIHRPLEVHTTPEQDQRTAAVVLADLLSRGLPALSWTLLRTSPDALNGSAGGLRTADEVAAVVADWADALGVEPQRSTSPYEGDGVMHTASAVVQGIRVTVTGVAR